MPQKTRKQKAHTKSHRQQRQIAPMERTRTPNPDQPFEPIISAFRFTSTAKPSRTTPIADNELFSHLRSDLFRTVTFASSAIAILIILSFQLN